MRHARFALLFTVCYQCMVISEGTFTDESRHMHPPPSVRNRVKRDDEKFHVDGYESTSQYWRNEGQKRLRRQLDRKINTNVAKNVIMFLGDGMSVSTTTAARIHFGQKMGYSGEESSLSFEEFPYTGFSKTYCFDKQTADSACSATAYLCGVKANYATLGVNPKVRYGDCKASLDKRNHVNSIMDWAQKAGKATGIVTTTRITHASPAGTYAHTANRDWETDSSMDDSAKECPDIAKQLIRNKPGLNFNVIYGGGRGQFFDKNIFDEYGQSGKRSDGLDLINEWITTKNSPKVQFIHSREDLKSLNHSKFDSVLGLFSYDHMCYNLQNCTEQPSLKEMTVSAIEILKKNSKGFVLFIEGGRIDHAHHQNLARFALDETVEFSHAIQAAADHTDEKETLIVVTADHAHTMTLSGYSSRGSDILGMNTEMSDVDNMPYLTLSYANGPSGGKSRYDMSLDDMASPYYEYSSYVPMKQETHGGDDVATYARGPYSHLFTGVFEQSSIPVMLAYASCIGEGLTACNKRSQD